MEIDEQQHSLLTKKYKTKYKKCKYKFNLLVSEFNHFSAKHWNVCAWGMMINFWRIKHKHIRKNKKQYSEYIHKLMINKKTFALRKYIFLCSLFDDICVIFLFFRISFKIKTNILFLLMIFRLLRLLVGYINTDKQN